VARALAIPPGSADTLIAASAVVLLPHLARLPLWLAALLLGLFGWRFLADHYRGYRPGRLVSFGLAIVVSIAVFKEYGTLLGRDPGNAMLAVLTGMKLLESRNLRDHMLVVFLLYLLTATNFLFEQSLIHGAYLVAAALAVTVAMARLNQERPTPLRANVRLAAGLLLKAVPLMLVMYLLFPRIQGGLWGLPPDAFSGITGLSEEVRPGSINRLSESEATAFRVEFRDQRPEPRALYWRAMVLWDTDGRIWRLGPQAGLDKAVVPSGTTPIAYTITMEPTGKSWLPALDRPVGSAAGIYRLGDHVLRSRSPVNKRTRFDMTSSAELVPMPLDPIQRRMALRLPPQTGERARVLAATWRARGDDAAVVAAALQYFNTEPFVYTLTPPLLGEDPVDEFLFDSRRGFCEHYATAFATLMRAAGVPTRLVIGYQGGDYNAAGDYLIVRQSDAHAWTEVWLEGRGWVRVDPTAAVAPERIELGVDAVRRLNDRGVPLGGQVTGDALRRAIEANLLEAVWRASGLYWDLVNLQWYRWVADYSETRQQELLDLLGFYTPGWLSKLVGMLAAMLVTGLATAWALRFRRGARDPARRAYDRYCSKLARVGLRRRAWEGALDYATRVRRARPDVTIAVEEITRRYVALRYADTGGATELAELKRAVRSFRPAREAA
jgi:transglutaminase-like putative cysteine protease